MAEEYVALHLDRAGFRVVTPDGYGVTCFTLPAALTEVWRLDDEGREPKLGYFDGERHRWAPDGIRQWRVPDLSTLPQTAEEGRAYMQALGLNPSLKAPGASDG